MAQTDFGKITEEVISVFGKDLINDLIKKLRSKNKFASGKLISSLTFKLESFATQYLLEFSAEDYLQNIEQGRKSGSYPPIKAIQNWVNLKGLSGQKGIEFAIQKSIYKFGIKPVQTLSEVIEGSSLSTYTTKIESDYVQGLEQYAQGQIQDTLNNK